MQETPPHFAPLAADPPKVVFWFRIYTGCMAALYVCCMLAAPALFYLSTKTAGEDAAVLKIYSVVLLIIGLVLAIVFALPFVLPRRPWVWIFDMVLICIGLTSCCIMPASIPLLIYWIKPEVKTWFQQG
jgi:MFS family permease